MTEMDRSSGKLADEALLSRSDDLLGRELGRHGYTVVTGYGTLDEIFETVTLVQTKKIRHFPIVATGRDYWQGMLDFISEMMFREGAAAEGEVGGFIVTDSVAVAVDHIEQVVRGTAGVSR